MGSYCDYARDDELHGPYHDQEYGFPETDESRLFERLILEVSQAGLNWALILKKRQSICAAYDKFEVDRVAAYGETDRARLLADAGIIRNRLKVNAAIENARALQGLRASHGGFAAWLADHHPLEKEEWVRLFKRTFRFTGGEITGEFLRGIGYLAGAHREDCPTFARVARYAPPWMAGDRAPPPQGADD
jgi:DNA-3-methyladenine glycosylase I